jgi:acetyl esterase/lipase
MRPWRRRVASVARVRQQQTAAFHATSHDGAPIELRWYTTTGPARAGAASPPEAEPGPAVVYAHGGGMVMGPLDLYDEVISWYVGQTGVPFLSVGYRRARRPR